MEARDVRFCLCCWPPYFIDTVYFTESRAQQLARPVSQQAPGLPSPISGFTNTHHPTHFHLGRGDLTSDPHGYMADNLLTKPFLQTTKDHLYFLITRDQTQSLTLSDRAASPSPVRSFSKENYVTTFDTHTHTYTYLYTDTHTCQKRTLDSPEARIIGSCESPFCSPSTILLLQSPGCQK